LSERETRAGSPEQSGAKNDGKAPADEAKRRPGGGTREDRRLLIRYHEEGDASAREELVERFLPLARQLARRYQRQNEPLDDLMQVASMGLVKAIDRFDPARGTAFSTYAVPTILGELKRYFRDSGWAVHVPRGMQERVMKLDQASQELHRKLGRSPSAGELADELSLTSEEVLEAMEAASAYDAISLEEQRGSDSRDSQEPTYADSLGTEEERYELVEYGATIAPTMKALSERERLILHLRFVEDLTQSEIADRIGVSQMHVSRLIRRALARLRAVARERELD
jgi:RNA polymerase sigma-B factor